MSMNRQKKCEKNSWKYMHSAGNMLQNGHVILFVSQRPRSPSKIKQVHPAGSATCDGKEGDKQSVWVGGATPPLCDPSFLPRSPTLTPVVVPSGGITPPDTQGGNQVNYLTPGATLGPGQHDTLPSATAAQH